jgi:hypothetical protein
MATQPTYVVDGPCQLYLPGLGNGTPPGFLGYSANGVELIEDVFMGDIPVDLNGGDLGPPGDIQYFGQIDRIRAELTLWDPAMAALLQPRLNGGVLGQIGTPGTLIASQGYGFPLSLVPVVTGRERAYSLAIPRAPIQRNKGSRFTRLVVEFECHAVNGVLFTSTGTG